MIITLDILRQFKTLNALTVAVLLEDHPEGLTAKEIGERLGMPLRSTYLALAELQNLAKIEKKGSLFCIILQKIAESCTNLQNLAQNDFEKETTEKALFPHAPYLEKESKEKEDYLSTVSSSRVREGGGEEGEEEGRRKIEDIILDNTEHLSALLQQCGLPPKPNLIDFFRPYAQAFCIHLQAGGDDLYLLEGDRRGVKNRFRYWFLKNYNNYDITAKSSGGGRRNSYGGGQLTAEQIEDQQHAKEARMKNSADLDQEYDAQQAAALTPGALSAKEAFFKAWDARMGRKREEDGAASGGSGDGRERRAEEGIGNPRKL